MTAASTSAAPRRSKHVVTVRALMIVVLLAALGLGLVVHRARVQRRAIDAIERAGGTVCFDHQRMEGDSFGGLDEPRGPRWLRSLIGDEPFRTVVYVSLSERPIGDDVAAEVAHFPRLEILYLHDSAVTDAGLKAIRGLARLRVLTLDHTRVGDDGLANLAGLGSLTFLTLDSTRVGDAGLKHLRGLPNLCQIHLSGTRVSDGGMEELVTIPRLRELDLEGTRVGKAGLDMLGVLDDFNYVTLSGPADDRTDALRKRLPELQVNWR